MKIKSMLLIALAAGAIILSSFKLPAKESNGYHAMRIKLKNQTDSLYYLGDTENGDTSAYAVYGTSTGYGATIVEVMKYSSGTYYSAIGSTSEGPNGGLNARLRASNGYFWNGLLVQ